MSCDPEYLGVWLHSHPWAQDRPLVVFERASTVNADLAAKVGGVAWQYAGDCDDVCACVGPAALIDAARATYAVMTRRFGAPNVNDAAASAAASLALAAGEGARVWEIGARHGAVLAIGAAWGGSRRRAVCVDTRGAPNAALSGAIARRWDVGLHTVIDREVLDELGER
jgi:hypothetical protein